jgi:hypothetical protein
MRILLANFKHLYQRRGLWVVYAGLGPIVWLVMQKALSAPTKGEGLFGGFLVCSFLGGLLVAALQMETASKPFSFCLPGHRNAVRGLVFLVGLAVSLVLFCICLALLASPSFTGPFEWAGMPRELLVLVLGSYFCASVAAYLLGAGVAFSAVHSASVLISMVLVASLYLWLDAFRTIQYPIIHWPVATIALAWVVAVASWWWLGRPAWFRRSCDRPWRGFFDPWVRTPTQRNRDLYATRFTKTTPRLDRFFQRVMGNRPLSHRGKCVWGALYTTCVLVGPQWKGVLTIALAWAAFAGYFPPVTSAVMGFLPLMTVGFLQSPLGTALLVAGGRRERFVATVALILGFSAVWVLLFAVFVGLTHLLAPVVPAVTVQGVTLTLHALGFEVLAIPLVVVPVVGLVQTLFARKPVALALSIMLVTTFTMISWTPVARYPMLSPTLAIAGTVLSWGICLSLLYRIAMHRDLVRQ